MPVTRRFSTEKKTTTQEGKREYQRKYMREYRAHRKKERAEQNDLFMRSIRLILELLDYPDVFDEETQNTACELLETEGLQKMYNFMKELHKQCEKSERVEEQKHERDAADHHEFEYETSLAGRVLPKMKYSDNQLTVTVGSRGRGK